MMDKTEILFVRACKSDQPARRVDRVYKSTYYNSGQVDTRHVISVLLGIVEKYRLMSIRTFAADMHPDSAWKFVDEGASYNEHLKAMLISRIRLTEVSCLPGYPTPARFRNDKYRVDER